MKKIAMYVILIAVFAVPAHCLAGAAVPGTYISGFVGLDVQMDADAPTTDFVTGKSYYDRVEFDPGIKIAGAVGHDFGIVRLEGEMSYKNVEIKSITNQVTGERFHNAVGDLGALAIMLNGFINLYNDSPVTPYLGGGVGLATIHLSDTVGTRIVNGAAQRVLIYGAGNDTVLAYQIAAGVDIAVNRHFSLDIGYRYFDANRANIDSDQAILTSIGFKSHMTALGFRYRY